MRNFRFIRVMSCSLTLVGCLLGVWAVEPAAAAGADGWPSYHEEDRWAAEIDAPRVIGRVQRILAREGYYNGAMDGLAGRQTREAVRRYQQNNGMAPDGRITRPLLRQMGLDHAALQTLTDEGACDRAEALRSELAALARRAERRGVQPWLVERLAELADSPAGAWSELVLREHFAAPGYRGGAGWRVVQGQFFHELGRGLLARAGDMWGNAGDPGDALELTLLDILLDRGHAPDPGSFAKMEKDLTFGDAFALRLRTGPLESTEGLALTVLRANAEEAGYSVVLQPGEGGKAKIFEIYGDNARERVLPFKRIPMHGRGSHTFDWTRSDSGEMVLAVDGQKLLRLQTEIGGPFAGLAVSHLGEQIVYQDIEIFANPRRGTR